MDLLFLHPFTGSETLELTALLFGVENGLIELLGAGEKTTARSEDLSAKAGGSQNLGLLRAPNDQGA